METTPDQQTKIDEVRKLLALASYSIIFNVIQALVIIILTYAWLNK